MIIFPKGYTRKWTDYIQDDYPTHALRYQKSYRVIRDCMALNAYNPKSTSYQVLKVLWELDSKAVRLACKSYYDLHGLTDQLDQLIELLQGWE